MEQNKYNNCIKNISAEFINAACLQFLVQTFKVLKFTLIQQLVPANNGQQTMVSKASRMETGCVYRQ